MSAMGGRRHCTTPGQIILRFRSLTVEFRKLLRRQTPTKGDLVSDGFFRSQRTWQSRSSRTWRHPSGSSREGTNVRRSKAATVLTHHQRSEWLTEPVSPTLLRTGIAEVKAKLIEHWLLVHWTAMLRCRADPAGCKGTFRGFMTVLLLFVDRDHKADKGSVRVGDTLIIIIFRRHPGEASATQSRQRRPSRRVRR
jgi:hypothetical protein